MKKKPVSQQAKHPLGWRLLQTLRHLFYFIKTKPVQKSGKQLRKLSNPRIVIMTEHSDHLYGYIEDAYGSLTGFPIMYKQNGHVLVACLLKEDYISPQEAASLDKIINGMVWLPADNLYCSNN